MDHRLKRRPCAAELGGHLAVQLGGRTIWADGVHVSGCASTPDVHWATDLGQSLPDAGNIAEIDVGLKVAVALLLRRRGRREGSGDEGGDGGDSDDGGDGGDALGNRSRTVAAR